MNKKLVLYSGGMDSLAIMLRLIKKYNTNNIITLGFNYGQRHFDAENKAASNFCVKYNIPRKILNVDLGQIGGCSLIDENIPVTTNMAQQRSTVVSMRNGIFLMYAASFAQVNDCDEIYHGACKEDFQSFRDCRLIFFRLMEVAIQAGLTSPVKGSEYIESDLMESYNKSPPLRWVNEFNYHSFIDSEKTDIYIKTPLIFETKTETMKKILSEYPVSVYDDSWSCYNGGLDKFNGLSCGSCCSCYERLQAFKDCGVIDPLEYYKG